MRTFFKKNYDRAASGNKLSPSERAELSYTQDTDIEMYIILILMSTRGVLYLKHS